MSKNFLSSSFCFRIWNQHKIKCFFGTHIDLCEGETVSALFCEKYALCIVTNAGINRREVGIELFIFQHPDTMAKGVSIHLTYVQCVPTPCIQQGLVLSYLLVRHISKASYRVRTPTMPLLAIPNMFTVSVHSFHHLYVHLAVYKGMNMVYFLPC